MPKFNNALSAQTPIGQGLNNIATAMFSGPTPNETRKDEALMNLYRAQSNDYRDKAINSGNERNAREDIAGIFEQMQQLQMQSDGMEDPGLESFVRSAPMGIAKHGMQGGLDATKIGNMMQLAMSQYANNDQLMRGAVGAGKTPNSTSAFTTEGQQEVNGMQTDRAIQQALAQQEGIQATNAAKPQEYVGDDGTLKLDTVANVIANNLTVPASRSGSGGKPLDVSPTDAYNLKQNLYDMLGVVIDRDGEMIEGSQPPLTPELEERVLNRQADLYQQSRNAEVSLQQAVKEIIGNPETLVGVNDDSTFGGLLGHEYQNRDLPTQPQQTTPAGPAPGTVRNGYTFRGGDPKVQSNWIPNESTL